MSEEKIYYNLGGNIRGLRMTYGESQSELAEVINKTKAAVSNYELGERIPERDVLIKIAKHYRVTENQLIYGDYSNIQKLSDIPINDMEYNYKMIEKTFPLIVTDEAMGNKYFREALDKHNQFLRLVKDGSLEVEKKFKEKDLKYCLELYEMAYKDGVEEGLANKLWWRFFVGIIYFFITPQLLERVESGRGFRRMEDFIKEGYLQHFDDDSEMIREKKEILKSRQEFLKENEVKILVDIYRLKHSQVYSDLADYYLALRYKFGLLTNSLSDEMNAAVGDEMLHTFSLMGNKYVEAFMTPLKYS